MPTLVPGTGQVMGDGVKSGQTAHEQSGTIDLKRGTVRVVPHGNEWAAAFSQVRRRIQQRSPAG